MTEESPGFLGLDEARHNFARSAFEEHRGAVYAVALRVLNDPALAEDVVQETFLQVYRSGERFRGECSVRGWVLTIAVNLSRRTIVRERARRPLNLQESLDVRSPSQALEGAELRLKVEEALSRLPFEHRAAITLSLIEGLSAKDIATILECKEGTVWSRIYTAKKRLAYLLSEAEAHRAS